MTTNTSPAIRIIRNTTGRIVRVGVPMMTADDPEWYKRAATAAGACGRTYWVDATRLLTDQRGNAKIQKGAGRGYLSAILHLAPHRLSGRQLCAAHGSCWKTCVAFNGKGNMANAAHNGELESMARVALQHTVQCARIARARLWSLAPDVFYEILDDAIAAHERKAHAAGLVSLIRSNGTSDIPHENNLDDSGQSVFSRHQRTQFYDYTKLHRRAVRAATDASWPANYDVTFSLDEKPGCRDHARRILELGGRVAVVVRTDPMRTSWGAPLDKLGKLAIAQAIANGVPGFERVPVVSGDETDLRHLDPAGCIVALYAKGRAARDDMSGFVVDLEERN